jgi:hypothetical protein
MKFSKILTGLGIVAAVVAIGLAVGWWASRISPTKIPATTENPTTTDTSNPPANSGHHTPTPTTVMTTPEVATNSGVIESSPLTTDNAFTNWEDKLDEILSSEADDTNKVKQLLAMFRHLPKEGQEEVAQHLSNLVDDENYGPLGELAADAKLPEDVLDVLTADLLNRPNATKLPLFLEIAQNPDHPKAGEAKDLLELYLDEDYGTDWPKWKQKMQDWLKENPD